MSSAVLALGTGQGVATTYYVATNGNNSAAGTVSSPWRTPSYGALHVNAGDTLYIRGGTYYDRVWTDRSGTAANPIVISGYPGETAIIDGGYTNSSPGGGLIQLQGSHVIVQDLTVRHGNGAGIALAATGSSNSVFRCNTYSNMESGITIAAPYCLIESNVVWWNAQANEYFSNTRGTWAGGLNIMGGGHSVARGNIVFNNWGEGMTTGNSSDNRIVGNTVYDNQTGIYIMDTQNSIVASNLVYSSAGNIFSYGNRQVGIEIGDENFDPVNRNNVIINNLVMGCYENLYSWIGNLAPLDHAVIANNTFVNAVGDYNVKFNATTNKNVVFANNLIEQDDSTSIGYCATGTMLMTNNLWSKSPPANLEGVGDVVAAPQLAEQGLTGAGQLSPEWFRLLPGSPARGAGVAVAGVTVDFFGVPRGNPPDIGACAYVGLPDPPSSLRRVVTK